MVGLCRLVSGNAQHFKTPLSTHQGYFVHNRPEVGTTNPGTFARTITFAPFFSLSIKQQSIEIVFPAYTHVFRIL
jgi:hypothetical protein